MWPNQATESPPPWPSVNSKCCPVSGKPLTTGTSQASQTKLTDGGTSPGEDNHRQEKKENKVLRRRQPPSEKKKKKSYPPKFPPWETPWAGLLRSWEASFFLLALSLGANDPQLCQPLLGLVNPLVSLTRKYWVTRFCAGLTHHLVSGVH